MEERGEKKERERKKEIGDDVNGFNIQTKKASNNRKK